MKKVLAVLATLLTACLIGSPALAAGSKASTAQGGMVTVTAPSAALPIGQPHAAKIDSLTEIYSNFNSDDTNLYDCCAGWTVSTRDSVVHARFFVAMPFTPAANGSVRKVVLGTGWVSGLNAVNVSLRADDGGLPGELLKRYVATSLPAFGTCCETVTMMAKGVPVTAGMTYWVVVRGTADTWAAWNFNTVGASGPFAFKTDAMSRWQSTADVLGAFRVLGD